MSDVETNISNVIDGGIYMLFFKFLEMGWMLKLVGICCPFYFNIYLYACHQGILEAIKHKCSIFL